MDEGFQVFFSIEVVQSVLPCHRTGRGGVGGPYDALALIIGRDGQCVEDASAPVVQQQDVQVVGQLGVPQGILVIEERQVADDEEVGTLGRGRGVAHGTAHAAFDAVDATVATDGDGKGNLMVLGIANRTAVGQVQDGIVWEQVQKPAYHGGYGSGGEARQGEMFHAVTGHLLKEGLGRGLYAERLAAEEVGYASFGTDVPVFPGRVGAQPLLHRLVDDMTTQRDDEVEVRHPVPVYLGRIGIQGRSIGQRLAYEAVTLLANLFKEAGLQLVRRHLSDEDTCVATPLQVGVQELRVQ